MAADPIVETVEKYLDTEDRCERAWLTGHEAEAPREELDALAHQLREQVAAARKHGRPPIGRMLVAVDRNGRAAWVLHHAAQLAESLSASIRVAHVVDMARAVNNEYGVADPNLIESLRQDAGRFLDALTAADPRAHDTVLREGDPGQEIVAAAREFGADLIVLATPTHGQFVELLTGSAAEWVMRHASCPVMLVSHPPAEASTPGPVLSPEI